MKLTIFFLILSLVGSGFSQSPQDIATTPVRITPEESNDGQVNPSTAPVNDPSIVIVSTLNPSDDTTTARPTTTPTTTPTTHPTTLPPVVPIPPAFPKNVGNWSVHNGKKSPCIMVVGALQVHLKGLKNSSDLVIDVPNTTEHVTASGKCGGDSQDLKLNWWTTLNHTGSEREHTLQLTFSKEENEQYVISKVKLTIHDVTPGARTTTNSAEISGKFFPTTLQRSYQCLANQNVEVENGTISLITQNLQFEAFKLEDTTSTEEVRFSDADHCQADISMSTSTKLWIAIGVGVLVVSVIALVVFLIKRCRRDGYQQLGRES